MIAQPAAGRLEVLELLRGLRSSIAAAEQTEFVECFERPRQVACRTLIESIAFTIRVPPVRSVDIVQRQDIGRQSI